MDVVSAVARAGGARLRRGLGPGVAAAVRAGALERHGSVVALLDTPADLVIATRLRGALSCANAARHQGLDLLMPPEWVHVTVPRKAAFVGAPAGVVVHHRNVPVDGGTTVLARTVADCCRCLPPVAAVVVVDSALRRGLQLEEIHAHIRGRAALAASALLALADRRSGSVGETVARLLFWRHGIDALSQAWIDGVGYVDFLVAGRVVVEIDGFAYHSGAKEFRGDRLRQAELVAQGYVVLRFTHFDVLHRPDYVVAAVLRVLHSLAA